MSDHRQFRDVLGRFATGVAVATAKRADGETIAMTVNSFTSISLDPPLVLWCVGKASAAYEAWIGASAYAISILGAAQRPLAEHCAMKGARSLDAPLETWATGAPILSEAIAGLDCRMEKIVDAGDHAILIGRVVEHRLMRPDEAPLTFYAGGWGRGVIADT